MDKRLQMIAHLYGEAEDRTAFRSLLEDEEVCEEHRVLSEIKFQLDHRRPARPDPVIIDRLMDAVHRGDAVAARPVRRDRPAMRLVSRRSWQWLAAAAVVALVGVGVMQLSVVSDQPEATVAERAAPRAGVPVLPDSVPAFPETLRAADAGADNPSWDNTDDLRQLYRRIERLREGNRNLEWGEPAVPLEMLPGAQLPVDPALQQAGERRDH